MVVLKYLKVNSSKGEETIKEFINKLKLLRNVYHHPNIIMFYGVTKGTLREYLKTNFTKLQWSAFEEYPNLSKKIQNCRFWMIKADKQGAYASTRSFMECQHISNLNALSIICTNVTGDLISTALE
ncbi:kinase-like protein [Gigaspora margarita]|uniref:Kinase-like protein n=1 Tax=Gigaspora margarita TaxID=4874 RepID=A0A8H3XGF6_GIGMA|nr:kinase-like protein [Gigaspora margarita]